MTEEKLRTITKLSFCLQDKKPSGSAEPNELTITDSLEK